MKSFAQATLLAILAVAPRVSAHTRFTTFFVNGVSPGDATCVRMDMDAETTTYFVDSIDSADMACGKGGAAPVDITCSAKTGDTITMLHREWTDGSKPGFIDPSHKGTCAIYMKKMADVGAGSNAWTQTEAAGDGWFKIMYDGYDESSDKWCTEKMIDNDGLMSAKIPSDLSGGFYLIRSEILALQFFDENDRMQPQFYSGCAQVLVEGNGNAQPETVSIPGYVTPDMKAMTFNIYKQPMDLPYPEFGPQAYGSSSGSSKLKIRDSDCQDKKKDDDDNDDQKPKGHWRHRGGRHGHNSTETSTRPGTSTATISPVSTPPVSHQNNADVDSESAGGSSDTQTDSGSDVDTETDSNIDAGSDSNTDSSPTSSSTPAKPSKAPTTSAAAPAKTSSSSSSSSNNGTTTSPSTGMSADGLMGCPENTVLIVGNLCMTEIPAWSGDTPGALPKCWAASDACWKQLTTCFDNLAPAINWQDKNAGCNVWDTKCQGIVSWCDAGNTQGPPDEGKILTPGPVKIGADKMGSVKAKRAFRFARMI